MIDRWTQFVADGDPGGGWTEFGAGQVLSLQPDGSRMVDDFAAVHQCDFWAGLRR